MNKIVEAYKNQPKTRQKYWLAIATLLAGILIGVIWSL